MDAYTTQPLDLAAGAVQKVVGQAFSFAILSATFTSDVALSTNGSAFFNVPFDIILEFKEPTDIWIKNTNASANTIVIGSGSAKIDRNVPTGAAVSITGTAATSVADGANVAFGAKADAAATTDAGTFTFMGLFKRLLGKFGALVKSTYTVDSLASTNAAVIKASAGRVYSLSYVNATAAIKIIRLYDKATAPTVGTDVSFRTIVCPANSSDTITWPQGDSYLLGIGIAITLLIAYNDATAVAAHDVQLSASFE